MKYNFKWGFGGLFLSGGIPTMQVRWYPHHASQVVYPPCRSGGIPTMQVRWYPHHAYAPGLWLCSWHEFPACITAESSITSGQTCKLRSVCDGKYEYSRLSACEYAQFQIPSGLPMAQFAVDYTLVGESSGAPGV